MKKQTLMAICLGSVIALSMPTSYATGSDKRPENVVKISKALENLQAKGFKIIRKIELDDDIFVASAINAEGKEVKVSVNAKTGELYPPRANQDTLSALEVAKKVEQAGYLDIYKIDTQWFRDKYEVKAFEKTGKKIELDVDAKTGKITKD